MDRLGQSNGSEFDRRSGPIFSSGNSDNNLHGGCMTAYNVLIIVEKRGGCRKNVYAYPFAPGTSRAHLLLSIQTNASAKFQPYERRTAPISLKIGQFLGFSNGNSKYRKQAHSSPMQLSFTILDPSQWVVR
ncbi:hypothetical protein LOAG_06214 [Loa loa]|uniref:Uncharacterized protein n=1 Tax=Loa loa TaxID=7209 RepID=A0A1S0TY97_LOALO|nr:hypothetical protein LOAG_06214 [Loa loa]EFO22272.1 hypothetical protein LOAG_06214 [Loa loa]